MIDVGASTGTDDAEDTHDADGPLDGVAGLVSHPETTRASSEYCTAFVNGRYVRSSVVRDAVVEAYGTQLAPDRYPFAVLFLSVDPAVVDVNVHPRKLEVRFADEDGVREQVRSAVEDALLREGLLRSSAPRGRSAPDQTTIAPGRDADAAEPGVGSDEVKGAPDRSDANSGHQETEEWAVDASEDRAVSAEVETASVPATDDPGTDAGGQQSTDSQPTGASSSGRPDPHEARERRRRSDVHGQARLGDAEPTQSFESLPSLSLLGQFRDTYVVAETANGLLLIDQHAADERVNYERLQATLGEDPTVQGLAEPVTVELTAREAAAVEARGDVLERLGFRVELGEGRTLSVTGVPATLAGADTETLVRDVCAALAEGEAAADATVAEALDAVLADLACYPSVTGNTSLTEGSIRELLAALDDCENPYACPHGRPVVIELDAEELATRFERDYPGHGGRRTE